MDSDMVVMGTQHRGGVGGGLSASSCAVAAFVSAGLHR